MSEDIFWENEDPKKEFSPKENTDKRFIDLAFQGNILLYYLKGEMLKLGSHLNENQRTSLNVICNSLSEAISFAHRITENADTGNFAKLLEKVYQALAEEAGKLSDYGAPMTLIAEEIRRMAESI